jgi:predicted transcriptional regulator
MMAFWQRKKDDFEVMDQIIQEHPGVLPAEVARYLGIQRSTIIRRLPSMEEAGFLYAEDEKGGLWPFKK